MIWTIVTDLYYNIKFSQLKFLIVIIIEINIDNKHNQSATKNYLCPLDSNVVKADLGRISSLIFFQSCNILYTCR